MTILLHVTFIDSFYYRTLLVTIQGLLFNTNMQSNAILQFETWSREETTFRAASTNVDRERKSIEESLIQLRLEHKQLSSDTRESADLLGRFHRDSGLLEQEKKRLSHQLKEERSMLEQCSHDAEDLLLQAKSAKEAYHQKIALAQTELTELMYQQEASLLSTMISTKTVAALLAFLLELHKHSKNGKLCELMGSMKAWTIAANSHENSIDEVDHLTKKVVGLRHLAMEILKEKDENVRYSSRTSL